MTNILGELTPADFLANYWQQQPLLVRNALPEHEPPLNADELAGLALEEVVEARLVTWRDNAWSVEHGPFDAARFATTGERDWTLLVQAVDLWVPQLRAVLDAFAFLPPWRLDDLMVSYAAPGGSVGPHFDFYDVFLLQAAGTRRWQIGELCDGDTALLPHEALRLVADFQSREEWVLHPGDLLYLPPRVAHWGIAEDDCLTYSVGFRSPTLADMLGDLGIELMATGNADHYRDPPLTPAMAGEAIDPAFVAAAREQLHAVIDHPGVLEDWFARFMTAPKYPQLVAETDEQRTATLAGHRYVNGGRDDDGA